MAQVYWMAPIIRPLPTWSMTLIRCVLAAFALTVGIRAAAAQSLELPLRDADARSGSAVVAAVRDLPRVERERVIVAEVLGGNVPGWYREFVPVTISRNRGNREFTVVFRVAPDYLAVGSDDDWFLWPLSPEAAQQIADATGTSLPTAVMVDAIWEQAAARLGPDSIAPSAAMITVPVFEDHMRMVRERREAAGVPPGALIAGHRKDVVLSGRLDSLPGRVAIYGWQRPDGRPIQPLWTGHTSDHVDYSHGIRLVSRRATLNGEARDLLDLLRDPGIAGMLTGEGPIARPRYPVDTPETP